LKTQPKKADSESLSKLVAMVLNYIIDARHTY
jgi:hypothetical protein